MVLENVSNGYFLVWNELIKISFNVERKMVKLSSLNENWLFRDELSKQTENHLEGIKERLEEIMVNDKNV